jgi:hypothetical protein
MRIHYIIIEKLHTSNEPKQQLLKPAAGALNTKSPSSQRYPTVLTVRSLRETAFYRILKDNENTIRKEHKKASSK